MSLQRFIAALEGIDTDLHVEELLDALWFAQLNRRITLKSPPRDETPPPDPRPGEPDDDSGSEHRHKNGTAGRKEREHLEDIPASAEGDSAQVYAPGSGESDDATIKASPVVVPAGHALPRRLLLSRAMRPFARKWASRRDTELDEQQTVELTADLGMDLYPVFRPLQERWYDVDVVLEDDSAVLVWQDTLRDFCQILRDTGAFRDVRRWSLKLDKKQPALRIARRRAEFH